MNKKYRNHDFIHIDDLGNVPGYECSKCKLYVYFAHKIYVSMYNLSDTIQYETLLLLSCEECIIKNIIE